jgi:hypothetical protein
MEKKLIGGGLVSIIVGICVFLVLGRADLFFAFIVLGTLGVWVGIALWMAKACFQGKINLGR